MNKVLRRSCDDQWIAGVMGGLAHYLGIGSGKLRLTFVIVSCLSAAFPGIFAYLILWFLIPKQTA
ncbi:PspC domain-containing protein [Iodobacter ciconiae]|uniref:PspC domain-containing protein n=1 Tax=Iodobacter ciconiae TaxID=2496266 RepID=A0A3S8ZV46_9NEIS|nr:PspC domain-containing protein [Iodobacter ciconiae]AZN37331.1 PspC domain-containing protein [Iodobacter ciconiae]